MPLSIPDALPVLRSTPATLDALLRDLPSTWTHATEGPSTWSPFDIVGHLIHGERTDWIPRVEHLLQHGDAVPFAPFERDAMFEASRGLMLSTLLDTFAAERKASLRRLDELALTADDLRRLGRHPAFGMVTLGQLLATWVVHDLDHVAQCVRVMACRYADEVGPWSAYLPLVGRASGR